ncbi:histidine kinase [Niastella vici]|uniref:Histidine kinase n=1 Tax=Niastella vici TaxID=1703345 RepID=A0A1V9FFW3_9BACT|nr:nickel-binding protein [Niastella vici]OQP57151.1 histidine kinase [Niastella vici]
MPIFMDRHDVSDTVTAETIANLHQQDLKIQDQFGCKGLTYWFDEKRKTAFCLIEAPDAEAILNMHNHSHGQVPHRVIEVDPGIVESFLGRIEDPENAKNTELNIINDPGFRTIMVITVKRSPLIHNDPAPMQDYYTTVLNLLNAYEGTPVKQTENYLLVSFKSVTNALRAALEIQLRFTELGDGIPYNKVHLNIGLSAGVPVTEKKLIFEEAIKLAERMCRVVKGYIVISSEVKELYNSENLNALQEGEILTSLSQADGQFLTLLMDYTEAVWNDTHFKVDDFSKPVGCSKSQLYRKLMALTGKSPNAFIRDYRLEEALTLLNKNAGNVSEIAFETGFSSPSYFSKCFQSRYGHMPSDLLSAKAG